MGAYQVISKFPFTELMKVVGALTWAGVSEAFIVVRLENEPHPHLFLALILKM